MFKILNLIFLIYFVDYLSSLSFAKQVYAQYYGDINNAIDDDLKDNYHLGNREQNYEQEQSMKMKSRHNKARDGVPRGNRFQAAAAVNSYTDMERDVRIMNQHQEQYKQLHLRHNYNSNHKCRIHIPNEAISKYPWANIVQSDKANQLILIEICCAGYGPIRWRGNTLCRPLCENCRNGLCVQPGVCQCYDEFVRNENGDCVFACPLGCLNGRCYLDGSCQCDPGYKLDETRKYCRPICSGGCGTNALHNCTEPEVCNCIKGYKLSDNDCQPVCQPECGIGGICRKPNVCDCLPGYTLKDGICQAVCYQKCENGICYSRNRCICKPGYTYHERSTQCIPM
uniref:EGF-like domain-containing protein n=1 Tax=Glossina austeni TaxID=7395 RepID=A0A1A9VXB7_GLOAU